MNRSKVAFVSHVAIGKIFSIIGYTLGVFSLIGFITAIADSMIDAEIVILVIIFLAISVFFIVKGIQIKGRIRRYKQYVSLISAKQMTIIDNLSASTGQSVDFVRKDLQIMIKKKLFANATIDMSANEIVIGGKALNETAVMQTQPVAKEELESYICPGCNAPGSKPKGSVGSCEYCGSPV